MIIPTRMRHALASAVILAATANPAWSFPDAQELLNDFTHYALIANVELAQASAQALLDSGITNAELATMLDEGKVTLKRFEDAISRAHMVSELEPVAAELARRVELGRLDLARDPKRIEQAIKMLTGPMRQRKIAGDRLRHAQEYSVPALLREICEGRDEQLKLACQQILVQIGPPAVGPLCEAVLQLTGSCQRTVCDVLGSIGYAGAAPYLRELMLDPTVDEPTRQSAERAFRSVGGVEASLSALYSGLARQYFDAHESLIAFPLEPMNNVWNFSNITGLSPVPVHTEIYCEIMAMRTAARGLKHDQANTMAVDIFVAANLKRENDLPSGASDPIYGAVQYTPEFYATVFGTQTCLNVLGLAIDRLDTPLVRDAIAALSKTTGGANLFARGQGRQPLLEALNYPDRRVQYEGALTLAQALPSQAFTGDHSVVPILASAVRMGNKSLAIVIADDEEDRKIHVNELQQMGFDIAGSGADVQSVHGDIARAIGIDLVALRLKSSDDVRQAINVLRGIPKTAAAPVVVVAGAADLAALNRTFRDDRRVTAVRPGLQPAQLTAAVEAVMQAASGGRMTDAEAEEYAIKALSALRDIAISRSSVYRVADAEAALADALTSRTGGIRLLVADIMALIDTDSAQRRLFDAALAAQSDEQVELLNRVADSVRLWGDRAEKRHVEALIALIADASGPTADAAAAVHGALNMTGSEAVKLIPTL